MGVKARYRTHQKEELLSYLRSAQGEHITVADVCSHLRAQGHAIGTTTVYRQLERMVDEGIVGKYVIDATTPACFTYLGETAHVTDAVCFHCKCDKCGRLIHLHCDELESVGTHLKEEHGFVLNPMRTVFYGICADCA
ncbi:MAG: transcriptional repressor [Lachnospiraceae bacterium]|nr:transcriptional repressor [Lachnospiraceae bacterium]